MTAEDDMLDEILDEVYDEETLDEIIDEAIEEVLEEREVYTSDGPTEQEIYQVAKKLEGYASELDEDVGILEELLNRNVAVCTKDGKWARGGMWKKYMRSNG